MTPVGFEPKTSRFGVQRFTTTPPRSMVLQMKNIELENFRNAVDFFRET